MNLAIEPRSRYSALRISLTASSESLIIIAYDDTLSLRGRGVGRRISAFCLRRGEIGRAGAPGACATAGDAETAAGGTDC